MALAYLKTIRRDCIQRAGAIATIMLATSFGAMTTVEANDGGRGVRLITQNMDVGSSFNSLIAAQNPQQVLAAVATIYNNILARKPVERAAAMAREIARSRPDLVTLQEAALLRTGNRGAPSTTMQVDLLQSLLDELDRLEQRYVAVAILPGFDAQVPSPLGFDVRVTFQDAILVRADSLPGEIEVSNLQIEQFGVKLAVPTTLGPFLDPRGWASVDVTLGGRRFRLVTTHLDSSDPRIRVAQARELLSTAANTSLPVVFAGDFNIAADTSLDPSFAGYQAMINAGFSDAWLSKRSLEPGYTCCQAENLLNPTSLLSHRIDLILVRGALGVKDISLIGDQPSDRTSSGLWPSDHAGVAVTLQLTSQNANSQ